MLSCVVFHRHRGTLLKNHLSFDIQIQLFGKIIFGTIINIIQKRFSLLTYGSNGFLSLSYAIGV